MLLLHTFSMMGDYVVGDEKVKIILPYHVVDRQNSQMVDHRGIWVSKVDTTEVSCVQSAHNKEYFQSGNNLYCSPKVITLPY